MKAFLKVLVAVPFLCCCFNSFGQTAGKDVSSPTEGDVLAAACNAASYNTFTNLFEIFSRGVSDRKATSSRLLFDLLADRLSYRSPQFYALEYLHKQGADVGYECPTNFESDKTPLQAAVIRGNLEFIKQLIMEGADINQISTGEKMTALEMAVVCGKERENTLKWLLEHGARVQEIKTGRSLLDAVLRQPPKYQDLGLLPLLVKAGADPYLQNASKKSAVDILAERRDIVLLRQLDKKGIYRSLIEQYVTPKNSPFVGVWTNEESFSLILNNDGMAFIGLAMFVGGPVPWRTVDTNRATIDFFDVDNNKLQEIGVEWISASNALRLADNGKSSDKYLMKQPGVPPTTDELRKKMNGEVK